MLAVATLIINVDDCISRSPISLHKNYSECLRWSLLSRHSLSGEGGSEECSGYQEHKRYVNRMWEIQNGGEGGNEYLVCKKLCCEILAFKKFILAPFVKC